jgi:hypothetical protein
MTLRSTFGHFADYRALFIAMRNVDVLSVVMLSVVILNVIILSVVVPHLLQYQKVGECASKRQSYKISYVRNLLWQALTSYRNVWG